MLPEFKASFFEPKWKRSGGVSTLRGGYVLGDDLVMAAVEKSGRRWRATIFTFFANADRDEVLAESEDARTMKAAREWAEREILRDFDRAQNHFSYGGTSE
jgi:hypothetical protein